MQGSRSTSSQSGTVKTIAVATFACEDPDIAQDVRNAIIAVLLDNYSIVIGNEADASITGSIALGRDYGSSRRIRRTAAASIKTYVSEIRADISKAGSVIDSVRVVHSRSGSASAGSAQTLGKEAGMKIMEHLQK